MDPDPWAEWEEGKAMAGFLPILALLPRGEAEQGIP
jgi:hypothetical protein